MLTTICETSNQTSSRYTRLGLPLRHVPGRLLIGLLAIQAALLSFCVIYQSPCSDEFGHAYAGLRYWQTGDQESFKVNPPLIRAIGSLPFYISPLPKQPAARENHPYSRPEFQAGRELYSLNGQAFRIRLIFGRFLVAGFAALGTVACYRLGNDLADWRVGLGAAAFWTFQPQILSHGALITNDVPVAATMSWAAWFAMRWERDQSWPLAIGTGVVTGVASSCKFTGLLLWPILILLIAGVWLRSGRKPSLGQVLGIFVAGWLTMLLPYQFMAVGTPLGEYTFLSDSLSGSDGSANRFNGSWLHQLPVLMPQQWLLGLDRQQVDFEVGLVSYAMGQRSSHGWWWFYLYSMAVKLPTGTLLAILVGSIYWGRGAARGIRGGLVLWLIALAVIEVTAAKSGFAQQHRYIFPLYPPLFVLMSVPLRRQSIRTTGPTQIVGSTAMTESNTEIAYVSNFQRNTRRLIGVGLAATVLGGLASAPDFLCSFNLPSGGNQNGHFHLFNDATDWGQDADRVKRWIDEHPAMRPLRLHSLNSCSGIAPETLGIDQEIFAASQATIDQERAKNHYWLISKTDLVMREELRSRFFHRPPDDIIGATHLVFYPSAVSPE